MQRVVRRAMSTAAAPAAPAAAAAAPPVPTGPALFTPQAFKNEGKLVTLPWNRYSLDDTSVYNLEEARKGKDATWIDTPTVVGKRKAVIYKMSQHALTSGSGAQHWTIRFAHIDVWTNPLMGWLSGTDTQQPVSMHMRFESAEQAIMLCERNGWRYELQQPYERSKGDVVNEYQANFLSYSIQTTLKEKGPRKARTLFTQKGGEGWGNWRRSQYGAEPWEPKPGFSSEVWTGPGWPGPSEGAHP